MKYGLPPVVLLAVAALGTILGAGFAWAWRQRFVGNVVVAALISGACFSLVASLRSDVALLEITRRLVAHQNVSSAVSALVSLCSFIALFVHRLNQREIERALRLSELAKMRAALKRKAD